MPEREEQLPRLMTTKQVAILTNLQPNTFAAWRCRKSGGPPWIKIGRLVRYSEGAVMDWLNGQRKVGDR